MRQFLAIELPEGNLEALDALQRRLRRALGGWRWVRPASIHLTVRFLGEVTAELDRAARDGWRRAASAVEPFSLRLQGLGRFPPGGRPRTLWVGAVEVGSTGRLAALALAVEAAAAAVGFAPEPRPFRAHLTLARADRKGRARAPEDPGYEDPQAVVVSELVLFRSELDPGGARYTVLERFALGRPAGEAGAAQIPDGAGPGRVG